VGKTVATELEQTGTVASRHIARLAAAASRKKGKFWDDLRLPQVGYFGQNHTKRTTCGSRKSKSKKIKKSWFLVGSSSAPPLGLEVNQHGMLFCTDFTGTDFSSLLKI